ncbi:MAG: hypothetical protein IJ788_04475 [Oscillospiraceae bacterium]|nr:hypothetical protein [Oscillospiraceae bacterium]
MKRLLPLVLIILTLTACSNTESTPVRENTGTISTSPTVGDILEGAAEAESAPEKEPEPEISEPVENEPHPGVDIDLTAMNSVMVYSEVSRMMYEPDEFFGKTVCMAGQAASDYSADTGLTYHAVIIADATACCAQGIEYKLDEGAEYPSDGDEVTVIGVFSEYEENGFMYLRLDGAKLI